MLDPRASKPANLEYLLFGRGRERFLAHAIYAPPDFDHVLKANVIGPELTDRDLDQDVRVTIADRKNAWGSDSARDNAWREYCVSAPPSYQGAT